MEKTMRRFTLLLLVALLGGTDRMAAQETVETRGITSVIKMDEVIFGHLIELNGKSTELTFAPDGYVGVHHHRRDCSERLDGPSAYFTEVTMSTPVVHDAH